MSVAHPPVTTAISPFLLANSHLLALLEKRPFHQPVSVQEMEEAVYLAYQPWQARHPDHVFRARWRMLCKSHKAKAGHWVGPALEALVEGYLHFQHENLHAKLDTYGEWQTLLSRISSLPVQAAAYASGNENNRFGALKPPHAKGLFPLIYPNDRVVEDYISREGLHETHLHLNGSTHAEWCWLRALNKPKSELLDFSRKYRARNSYGARIRELCHSINPSLTPAKLDQNLRLARRLRRWLIAIADGRAERFDAKNISADIAVKSPMNVQQLLANDVPFYMDESRFSDLENGAIHAEMDWLILLLTRLSIKPDPLADRLLHLYLLLQSEYMQLTVQREDMYGFDQFQKYTLTDLREPAEKNYLYRFRQMNGPKKQRSRTGWVEGRFAPKDNIEKNSHLFADILGGYLDYLIGKTTSAGSPPFDLSKTLSRLEDLIPNLNEKNTHVYLKLTLVMHFIKQSWEPKKSKGSYRHSSLRRKLEIQTRAMCETMKRWPKLRNWVRGIDAAANELHTSPEVFAPFFRVCQRQGLTHKTYHTGEDYPHLISGIRHVADTLELLDMRNGDRIGHGTALGIDPALWLASMPRKLVVNCGEWMLDLLMAWRYLRDCPQSQQTSQKLASEVIRLANRIFGTPLSCESLELLMLKRGLLPRFVIDCIDQRGSWNWRTTSVSDAWREEAHLVHLAQEEGANLELLVQWWCDESLWKRSEEQIEVDANHLDQEMLTLFQQRVMCEIRERRVVIETLPTSNVRISQYQHHRDHHALRWLKADGFTKIGDPDVMISLGSDDPGIFSNDLSSDFYQLYAVLRENGISDTKALNLLATANERGRQYRFHDKNIFG